jgi:5,10-methylenetetrahydromethanopterin reductase
VSDLRFALRIPPCEDLPTVAAFAVEAEDAGFDMAWFPDSQFLWRDVWATLAVVAGATNTIGLGTAVTNFETRHLAVTAAAASTIEELAPGRLQMTIGSGDSSIKTLGLAPTKLAKMREGFDSLRKLLAGETLVYGEEGVYAERRMRVRVAPGRPLPLLMAASGPKALALAGEIGDGVLINTGLAPALVERARERIDVGAKRAGRSVDDIPIWISLPTAITPDAETAARYVKPLCVTLAQLGASDALEQVGISIDVPAVVPGIYPDVTHAENWEAAVEACDQYVDDESADLYARNFTLAGTADDVIARLDAARELGIRHFSLKSPLSYDLPRPQLEALRDQILPRTRARH